MNISREWQTSVTKLNETRRADCGFGRLKSFDRCRRFSPCFLLGGGRALEKPFRFGKDSEPPLARRYNAVEEQYVFACS